MISQSSVEPDRIASGCFGLPKIKVPSKAIESSDWNFDSNGYLTFDIDTPAGKVRIRGLFAWDCTGSAEALAAADLVRFSWLPGLPGNNKLSQRILFEQSGPRPLIGNLRGALLDAPVIVIARTSKNTYCVRIPPSKEQISILDSARERYVMQQEAARKREREALQAQEEAKRRLTEKLKPASVIRKQCTWLAHASRKLIQLEMEDSSFRPSSSMAEQLEEAFSRLEHCIMNGTLVSEHSDQANVVPLHKHSR